jgi:hypothetical protein
MMDLRNYPLDEQNCTVEIESCEFPNHCQAFDFFPAFAKRPQICIDNCLNYLQSVRNFMLYI